MSSYILERYIPTNAYYGGKILQKSPDDTITFACTYMKGFVPYLSYYKGIVVETFPKKALTERFFFDTKEELTGFTLLL